MKSESQKAQPKACYQCEGKGYTELRDCAGEIQRTETCSFCEGRGYVTRADEDDKFEVRSL